MIRWLVTAITGLLVLATTALQGATATANDPAAAATAHVAAAADAPSAAPSTPSADPSAAAQASAGQAPSAQDAPATASALSVDAPAKAAPAPTLSSVYAAAGVDVPTKPVARDGCPPPKSSSSGGVAGDGGSSWTPPNTVPESALPNPLPPGNWTSSTAPFAGKGMWIWQYSKTEGENFQAIVDRAVAAGLDQIWVRVGDSHDDFYAGERLNTLVPLAHAKGLKVVGWFFPFLHDPVADAAWTKQVIDWRSPDGQRLDGISPDIEMATEGVKITPKRVQIYLGLIRQAAGDLPIAATVYPPVDWVMAKQDAYPFDLMAKYVDAFAPMAYWMCTEPGHLAAESVDRLADLRPVHVIGQAFHNVGHGRRVSPSRDEVLRFLDASLRHDAIGASLWVWQDANDAEWGAITDYPWHEAAATR